MKLWMMESSKMPKIFIKADSELLAMRILKDGFDQKTFETHIKEPTFKVYQIVSLEQFLKQVPQEFMIQAETSF
jgi:hypothetical protein